jgi:hypothetical protein
MRLTGLILFLISFYTVVDSLSAQIPSFPGAEGFGSVADGGRGGRVIYVSNLRDDNNPGSLRYAINQTGPRLILFKISGTIQLKSTLNIVKNDVTIAGQTAPGDGICLRDYAVTVEADNVIIRFIRFRMGDEANQQNDCIWGRNHNNIIIDHCTMSWSTDECSSFYDNTNFTMQWCLLSESLRNSVHDKGSHGYGGIWGGKGASFHHNLLADHDSRNPRFCGSRYSDRPDLELVDFRNNVVFNWGSNSGYAGEGGRYNIVNNYYKAGPATSSSSKSRIFQPFADDGTNSQPAGRYGTFYVSGNYVANNDVVTSDNWLGISLHTSFSTYAPGITINNVRAETAFPASGITMFTAQDAYRKVLDYAGASLVRDTIDKRIIHDVRSGSVTYTTGGNGSTNGIIDTQGAVGGWPQLNSTDAPPDTDNDGIPDAWEKLHSLNPDDPADGLLYTLDGKYTNVEVYINSLVGSVTENQSNNGIYTGIERFTNNGNKIEFLLWQEKGTLMIVHRENIRSIEIFSATGQLLLSRLPHNDHAEIPVPCAGKGLLIVRLVGEDGTCFSRKILNLN